MNDWYNLVQESNKIDWEVLKSVKSIYILLIIFIASCRLKLIWCYKTHSQTTGSLIKIFPGCFRIFFCLSRCAIRLYNEVNCVTKRQRKKFFYSKSKKDRALIFNVCQESVEGQKKKFKRFFLCVKLINRSLSKDNFGKIKPRTLVRPCLFFRLRDDIIFNDNKKGSIRLII